jgi:nucleotide-binding universal stress UspA family protein
MFSKILVAYDDSEHSHKAFTQGLEIAKKFNATLFVLSVVKLPEPAMDVETEEFTENATQHYKKMFSPLKAKADAANLSHDYEVIVGHPAETIVDYANDKHIDLIMIGSTKGKSFLKKIVLGSVSRKVVDHAHCSVMVVR